MSGVTLDDDRAAIFPAGTKLRLLRDRLLVRPLEWVPSRIITTIRHGRPVRGIVEAVGPGRLYRRYRPHPTDARKRQYVETRAFIRSDVRVGDIIELGGLNIFDGQGYNFPQVIIGTERFLICQEQDVCFVHEKCLDYAGDYSADPYSDASACVNCGLQFSQHDIANHMGMVLMTRKISLDEAHERWSTPWCCEKGRAAGVQVCPECQELFGSIPA